MTGDEAAMTDRTPPRLSLRTIGRVPVTARPLVDPRDLDAGILGANAARLLGRG